MLVFSAVGNVYRMEDAESEMEFYSWFNSDGGR